MAMPWSRQYASIIFYHNEAQQRLALETGNQLETRLKGKVFTEVIPYTGFYLAEDYHQKYYLRRVPELINQFKAIYPATPDLVASTAAARVNGYIGGNGTLEALQKEIDILGLSPHERQKLLDIVSRGSS